MSDNDPKYDFSEGRVHNAVSGEHIPFDEPVMVFRARDIHSQAAIGAYLKELLADRRVPAEHIDAVTDRWKDFLRFSEEHGDRMKVPDTEPSK